MINLFNELLNKGNQKTVIESLIIEHIKYVMRKMNSTQRKGKKEINYGIQLIKEVLSNIFKDKDLIYKKTIFYDKKIFYNNKNILIRNGLINDLIYNPNLNFDQKEEMLKVFQQIYTDNFEDTH